MTPQDMAALHRAGFDQSRPWRADEFETLIASPHVFALGDAYAFALGRVVAGEAELLTITTHPALRRRGLARDLVICWQAEAARRGALSGFLEVAADNAPALALYTQSGFAKAGLRRAYYPRAAGKAVDGVVMTCALGPLGPKSPRP